MQFSSNFKGRTFTSNEKVAVYRNLNNGLFSVKALTGEFKGKVVGHFASIQINLTGPRFKISQAGQLRARKANTRNVHAFLIGEIQSVTDLAVTSNKEEREITYNPFIHNNFVIKETGETADFSAITSARLCDGRCYLSP